MFHSTYITSNNQNIIFSSFCAALAAPKVTGPAIAANTLRGSINLKLISLYSENIPSMPVAAALGGMTTETFIQSLLNFQITNYSRIIKAGARYGTIFSLAPMIEKSLTYTGCPIDAKFVAGGLAGASGLFISEIDTLVKGGIQSFFRNSNFYSGFKSGVRSVLPRSPGMAAIGAVAYSLFGDKSAEK